MTGITKQHAGINNMGTLEILSEINPIRCKSFGHSVDDMSVTFWATALAGEVGELCNFIKKKERGDAIDINDIGKEAADVVIYLDLLCTLLNINLCDFIKLKFNEVSDRVNSDVKF